MFYTHECKDDEIAYFKVDVNLLFQLPNGYLGNVWVTYTAWPEYDDTWTERNSYEFLIWSIIIC